VIATDPRRRTVIVRLGSFTSRDIASPEPPRDVRHQDAARLLFAFLDAVAGADSSGELALLEVLLAAEDEEFPARSRHQEIQALLAAGLLPNADLHVAAEIHSELARQAARAAGLLSDVEHWLWRAGVQVSPEGRALLRRPYNDALDELAGFEDVEGWHPGRAALTPQEQAAFRLSLVLEGEQNERGTWSYSLLQPWEIARRMSRRRGDSGLGLSVEQVDKYLWAARRKVREYLLADVIRPDD
jgi:hypothetical protein